MTVTFYYSSTMILEEAPQGIGAAKPVRLPCSITQSDSIQPKSILIQPKSRSRAGNVDLGPDSVNPCAICATGDQQKSSGYLNSSHTIPNLS